MKGYFGRLRPDGNVDVFVAGGPGDGWRARSLCADVYPVGSQVSARYWFPNGIVLTPADATRIGLEVEAEP